MSSSCEGQVKGYDQRLDNLTEYVGRLSDENRMLAERVLRLGLQLQYQKDQQAAERENFRLHWKISCCGCNAVCRRAS